MSEFLIETTESTERTMLWKALVSIATGALLGVLVGIPYDRLFGLSPSLCSILQSVIATAALTGLTSIDLPVLWADALSTEDTRSGKDVFETFVQVRRALVEKVRRALEYVERIPGTLKVQFSTHKLGAS